MHRKTVQQHLEVHGFDRTGMTESSVLCIADLKHSDAGELRKLSEAKEQVAARMEKLENAVVAVEEEIAQLRSQLVDGPVSV